MSSEATNRDADSGDIVQTVLIVAVFLILVVTVGSILFNAISKRAHLVAGALSQGPVVQISERLESYIVKNPGASIPETTGIISYDDYVNQHHDVFAGVEKGNGVSLVMATALDNGKFQICVIEDEVFANYDSSTGKTVLSDTCS